MINNDTVIIMIITPKIIITITAKIIKIIKLIQGINKTQNFNKRAIKKKNKLKLL